MLQLRCATLLLSQHACTRTSCPAGTRPASIEANRDERESAHGFGKMEETMTATNRFWRYLVAPLAFAGMLSISSAAELTPAAVIYHPLGTTTCHDLACIARPVHAVRNPRVCLHTLQPST